MAIEDYEQQVRDLAATKANLLNLLNVIIMGAGGRIEIRTALIADQRGYPVHVDTLPPDPEVAGSEGMVVLTLDGWKPPQKQTNGAAERLKDRGLWLPGQEDR